MPPRAPPRAPAVTPEQAAAAAAELERQVFIEQCVQLKKLKQLEEAQFNEFQLQKDKLNHFWIIEKKNLEDKKAELRNKEREMQDLEEKHEIEIKVLKQRVKHLLYEHQNESTTSKTEGLVSLKMVQGEHAESEAELKHDRRELERILKEMEVRHEAFKRELGRDHDRELTRLRLDFERESRELQMQYEDLMEITRRELFERRESDIKRIEERKAKHIARLMEAHEKAFADIKAYYSDITQANLDMIKSLKEEVKELADKEISDEKRIVSIAQENKRMSAPLARALEESRQLREEKERYEKELIELRDTKARILVCESQLKSIKWENEILEQRLMRLKKERDELYDKFTEALYTVQQKSGFRRLLLEKKIDAAGEEVEKRGAHLAEVLAEAHLDPALLGSVERQVDEVLDAKDATIRELQSELQRVMAAHERVNDTMRHVLSRHGVPLEEVGFTPVAGVDAAFGGKILGVAGLMPFLGGASGAAGGGGGAPAAGGAGSGGGARSVGDATRRSMEARAAIAGTGIESPRSMARVRRVAAGPLPTAVADPSIVAGGPKAEAAAAALRRHAGTL